MEGAIFILSVGLIITLCAFIAVCNLYRKLRYVALCGCKFIEEKDEIRVIGTDESRLSVASAYNFLKKPKHVNRFSDASNTLPDDGEEYLVGSWKEKDGKDSSR